ncbi:MAG: hypothetical protein Kow0089_23170 [Desulfobulbaceae bacterium]
MRRKDLFQNFLLTLATLLLLLVAGEVLVRFCTDLSPPLLQRDAELGMIFRPGTVRTITGPESGREVTLRISHDGFRTPDRPLAKPEDTIRVALIGDSQVAAVNTPAEATMAVLLEQELNRRYPLRHWEVFNFGVSGASTAQELVLYRKLVRRYDPDLVVLAYYNGNDFADNSLRLSRKPGIYMDLAQGSEELVVHRLSPERRRLSNWLNAHSRLYVWQKHFVGDAINNFLAAGGAGHNRKMAGEFLVFVDEKGEPDLEWSWRINERILSTFADEVAREQTIFFFLSIPHVLETTPGLWSELLDLASGSKYEGKVDRLHPERRLRAIVEDRGINHLFLRPAFEHHLRESDPATPGYHLAYRQGLGHLNETGNRLMTETLLAALAEQGIIARLLQDGETGGRRPGE